MRPPLYNPLFSPATHRRMKQVLDRLKEPSTWLGIVAVLGVFGVTLEPELKEHIIAVGVGIAGIIQILRREKKA